MSLPAETVTVRLANQSYDISIQPGLLDRVGAMLASHGPPRLAFVVTDRTVGPLYAQRIVASLRHAGFSPSLIDVPAGETHKTLATVEIMFYAMLARRVERSSLVLALGGGVIGDMAGFAAATVLRGIRFVQIPTTLLAMVDASVGGKTGVNHAAGKNLIGSFHQPIAVMIDPGTLSSLPPAILREGLAECIKHDIIRDADGFADLERNISKAIALDMAYLTKLVRHNVAIKARVVEADPTERGERAHLNLGHTFGHAIEKVSDFSISHGEAVALGTCAAAFVANELKLIDPLTRRRIVDLFRQVGLPTGGIGRLPTDELIDAMASDKKVEGAAIRLVLPDGLGHAVVRSDVPGSLIRNAIESIRTN